MPYVLPALTILFLAAAAIFLRPQITGLAIVQPRLNAEIKLTVEEILPENAVIIVLLSKKDGSKVLELINSEMKDFVNEYKLGLSYDEGSNTQLNYQGYGFLGEASINITKSNINIPKGSYVLITEILYNNEVVSSGQQNIDI